ncbi:MAG TPA: hypothetical protein VKY19_26655 [Ktedonosporobacter sp.]|nr:hypothetical protein [Ktedonosporobacter sp.]
MRRLCACFASLGLVAILLAFSSPGIAFAASSGSGPTATQAATKPATSKPLPPALDPKTYQHPNYTAAQLHQILLQKLARLGRSAPPRSTAASTINASYVSSTAYPVLFIHGISNTSSTDCGEWNSAKSFLKSKGWSGTLTSLQFYSHDTNCNANLASEASNCTGYHDSGSSDGTNNEDIRHVSCELAWYIWDHFTQFGQNVQVVAHSMGGLVTRWALYATPFEPALPPFLLVQDIVTMGTPHDGAPPAYAFFYCSSCTQGGQIETLMPFMQELINKGQNPQANDGTDWTMLGSQCDIANVLNSNDTAWMTGGHKVIFKSPCYDHGGYMGDTATSSDASMLFCDFCGTPPVTYSTDNSSPHSLGNMFLALELSTW